MAKDVLTRHLPAHRSLSIDSLKDLARVNQPFCVSIFMPTHKDDSQVQQNQIRFKNLINQAEKTLLKQGLDPAKAQSMLEPARVLLEETLFWTARQNDGFAVLLNETHFNIYLLPISFEERLKVGSRFYLKPFFNYLSENGLFYILALSQNSVRFFEANHDRISEIPLNTIPKSLDEALRFEVTSRQPQFRTNSASGRPGAGIFYDQGSGYGDNKDAVQRYLHQVERGVTDWLKERRDPLLLMGVEYLLPLYRNTNRYPALHPGGIVGNPEGLDPNAIHAQAWEKMKPFFRIGRLEALELYRQLAGEGRLTSSDPEQILYEASQGRVLTLFVDTQSRDSSGRQLQTNGNRSENGNGNYDVACDHDIHNLACLETVLHRGTVYPMGEERITASGIAAIYRY